MNHAWNANIIETRKRRHFISVLKMSALTSVVHKLKICLPLFRSC